MTDHIDTAAMRERYQQGWIGRELTLAMCDEIDRLRGLIAEVCPDGLPPVDEDGDCVYCRAYIADDEPHQPACPWARARAEVLPHRVRNGVVEHDTGPSGCCPKDGEQ